MESPLNIDKVVLKCYDTVKQYWNLKCRVKTRIPPPFSIDIKYNNSLIPATTASIVKQDMPIKIKMHNLGLLQITAFDSVYNSSSNKINVFIEESNRKI